MSSLMYDYSLEMYMYVHKLGVYVNLLFFRGSKTNGAMWRCEKGMFYL